MSGRAAAPWESRTPGVMAPWLLRAVRDLVGAGESDERVADRLGVNRHVVRRARAVLAAEADGGKTT